MADSPWFGVAAAPLLVGAGLYVLAPTWPPFVGELSQVPTPAGTFVRATIDPVGSTVGLYLLLLVGLGLVVQTVLGGDGLFAAQSVALVLGTVVTVVASALRIAGVPSSGYPVAQVALIGQSLLWGYAVFRQRFLQVIPAVGRVGERAVFDELNDGVVVVDAGGVVSRVNPQAGKYLDADDVVGDPVGDRLDEVVVGAVTELLTRFERRGRTYQVKASTVTNWRDARIGHALVIRDSTPLTGRQQRLQVLNRSLRHNVGDDMTVLFGIAGRLRKCDDEELATMGETMTNGPTT